MKKNGLFICSAVAGVIAGTVVYKETRRKQQRAKQKGEHIPFGPYEALIKRLLDLLLSGIALLILSPVLGLSALFVKIKMGSPILFIQERPGLNGVEFKIFKFRTMTNKRTDTGQLLPDAERLTDFGKMLRNTSLDELPELLNIIKGDMAIVGPRPLLMDYLPRYSEYQNLSHDVRPGLTGLAQVNGRNKLSWEERLNDDVDYVKKITFLGDVHIIFRTIVTVLKQDGINSNTSATMETFMGN